MKIKIKDSLKTNDSECCMCGKKVSDRAWIEAIKDKNREHFFVCFDCLEGLRDKIDEYFLDRREKMQRKIGETFEYKNKKYRVENPNYVQRCEECVFYGENCSKLMDRGLIPHCERRWDLTEVIFVKEDK